MRPLIKLYLVVGLAFCSILFSASKLASFDRQDVLTGLSDISISGFLGSGKGPELVVFGGSWSDVYQNAGPGYPTHVSPSSSRGWTEQLCVKTKCLFRNYAGLGPKPILEIGHQGAAVENGLHTQGNFRQSLVAEQSADLKTQMKAWSRDNESIKQRIQHGVSGTSPNRTIFVFDFGLWDIWQGAVLDPDNAEHIVNASISIIFEALDYLVDVRSASSGLSSQVRAILPLVVDMTFLPGYPRDPEVAIGTLDLVVLWNEQLLQRAKTWVRGELVLYDTNTFMIEHIRARQMVTVVDVHAVRMVRDAGSLPAFADVSTSCVSSSTNNTTDVNSHNTICASPDDYLFWYGPNDTKFYYAKLIRDRDDVHLSPKAHDMIAQEILTRIETKRSGWL